MREISQNYVGRLEKKSNTNAMNFHRDQSNFQKMHKYRMGEIWPKVLPVKNRGLLSCL